METKDTLLDAFKSAAEKEKPIHFSGMEDVWQQIEAKLDEKETSKIIPIWKKWSVAAAILIVFGIGGFVWMNKKSNIETIIAHKKTTDKALDKVPNIIKDSSTTTIDKTVIAQNNITKTKRISTRKERIIGTIETKGTPTVTIAPLIKLDLPSPGFSELEQQFASTPKLKSMSDSITSNNMDEAVVVGYGTQKKKDLTASGKSINIKQIGDQPTSNVTQLLQGKVAGLAIGSSNTSRVRVRGINSNNLMDTLTATEKLDDVQVTAFNRVYRRMVTGSSTTQTSSALVASNQHHSAIRGIQTDDKPLFVVNNQIVDISLMKIDVDNVKSITVLKTKESIALYGSKGEKGAVLIETKAPVYYVNNIDKESYETYQENDFISAKNKPYSTFSIDVDNASYTNIRRFINHGQPIPKDAVRIEEMINFFKYNTPQPKNDHPYTINTEYGIAPWNPSHNILKVSLQGKTIIANQLPASNIVFLIDVSGSMDEPNKLPLLQASMKMLVGKMRAQDKVSIVTYAGNAGLVLPATSGAKKDTILHAIDKLSAGGSTAGAVGIELAYKIAKEQFIADGNNRVILATDGDFNVGVSSDSDLETLISEKRKSNIFLTCLGFGMGNYKDSKMQTLAQKGNGNCAYIDNIQEANRVLVKEFGGTMFTIAKDVKLQLEFNPRKVKAYRLIGYETRHLEKEDFANDSIDAGEMGSGHMVTALYEIIPSKLKEDSSLSVNKPIKYKDPKSNLFNNRLAYINTRYKLPTSNKSVEYGVRVSSKLEKKSSLSPDYRLATTVAWFGLKLRDSKLVPDKSTKDILNWGKFISYDDPDGYIAELFRLIETQQ